MPSRYGIAEVTWPFRLSGSPTLPAWASTVTSRVPLWVALSSVNCDTTADSPCPQPGEKYARDDWTGSLVTLLVVRSMTAVKAPRVISAGLLVKVRGA
jgi:hypothetical protein